jgi:protein TonB
VQRSYRQRLAPAALTSLLAHSAVAVLVLFLVRHAGQTVTGQPMVPEATRQQIVWIAQDGPGGGGGGGGNRMKEPPRPAQAPGRDAITVPVTKPPAFDAPREPRNEPDPIERLEIPAEALAASRDSLPGALDGPPALSASQGPGTGGGAGDGAGTGIGPDTGSGLGPGRDRGTNGDAYRVGSGVTSPTEIRRGTPRYTADAMRARIQGSVLVECVVETNGVCSSIRVLRSLEPSFGLNDEALKAASQWRFRPGTRLGAPVPVLVTMEITFALR